MRTSHSHPLQIAEVAASPAHGIIGITFCPGKKQPGALTGAWDRDLGIDLDLIRDWGAAAVVTLIEDHEMQSLQVAQLGAEVAARHKAWYHLPIRDVSTPTPTFEANWATAGAELRSILESGFNVLVHCKGGLGRAGTISARLLIELGLEPERAVQMVRAARPGAIETRDQLDYVLGLTAAVGIQPDTSGEAIADRAEGALLGLAVGEVPSGLDRVKVRTLIENATTLGFIEKIIK